MICNWSLTSRISPVDNNIPNISLAGDLKQGYTSWNKYFKLPSHCLTLTLRPFQGASPSYHFSLQIALVKAYRKSSYHGVKQLKQKTKCIIVGKLICYWLQAYFCVIKFELWICILIALFMCPCIRVHGKTALCPTPRRFFVFILLGRRQAYGN